MKLPVQTRGLLWLIVISVAAVIILDWSYKPEAIKVPEPLVEKYDPPAVRRASANLPALFSTDDYPEAALRLEEQGTVAFTLSINKLGRVERCFIVKGSGSAVLDQTTCRILTSRARFTPARGANGEAVADLTNGRIRWQLPDE